MQLELKIESNSPFWLIGAGKNGTFGGSNTNIPCFAKSIKKQKELASQILKSNDDVLEVYLLTGVQWDNMPSGRKEELGYIKNKGKMILSKDQLNEGDYPKGVSRDPLPKKGVKTYTSVATALEGKGDEKMKLELNDEKIVKEELISVDDISEDLQDRFFTTMSDGRPEMFKKFTKDELKLFADFVKQLPKEEITDLERSLVLVAISLAHGDDLTIESIENPIMESTQDLIDKYDIDVDALKAKGYDLVVFRCKHCKDDLKEYNPYVYDDGTQIPLEKIKVIEVKEHDTDCENAEDNMHSKPQKMAPIQLWKYSKVDVVKESNILTNKELIKQYVDKLSDDDKKEFKVDDIMKKIDTLEEDDNDIEELATAIQDALIDSHIDIKPTDDGSCKWILKESKTVSPVGNPQVASSFVNIDVDLDHMEVSDFIVRLAQAIRSEQTSVLEYVALRSANGITNEERTNIDAIIEEEKNHMVAFTTMLYKQLLTNHKQNVDGANEEFTLPTFGLEIFDNSEDGKLTESIASTVEKLALKEVGIRMSDEYFIGNNEDGRMYHGLGAAMNAVRNAVSTSGEQVVIQNVTLADSIKEDLNVKLDGETMSQTQWDVVVDVDYDEDFHLQVLNNLTNAIEELNKVTISEHYGIATDRYTLGGGKFNFIIITKNAFTENITEEFVANLCDKLFERATNYEYYIKRA